MITNSQFHIPGLGNILFRYASMIGISRKLGHPLALKDWQYGPYFNSVVPMGRTKAVNEIQEACFTYDYESIAYQMSEVPEDTVVDITGYLQSYKYWEGAEDHIKAVFEFKQGFEFQAMVRYKMDGVFGRKTIAIHIRRGDYVGNPNYVNLPITYYIDALRTHFPDYPDYNIIIFSDDIQYCMTHFDCMPNVFFADGSDIEDLCVMSKCDNFILSNSTFSWWGAYLNRINGGKGKVIRPEFYFSGALESYSTEDFWLKDWISHSHLDEDRSPIRINMKDCTFIIPVTYDHPNRAENLFLTLDVIQRNFDTNVIITENKTDEFYKVAAIYEYRKSMYNEFHRTRMLNDMIKEADTPIVINWDSDVFIPPMQLLLAVEQIRKGVSVCYPYDGRFARMPRRIWFNKIFRGFDIGVVGGTKFDGLLSHSNKNRVGGAIVFNKYAFINGGMENENFVSFSAEDSERFYRFTKLGHVVTRVAGPLYHLEHWRGVDSCTINPFFMDGYMEYQKVSAMSKEHLEEYIKTWEWVKELI